MINFSGTVLKSRTICGIIIIINITRKEVGSMKFKTIVPNYFGRFRCIGSECRNTCCKDWTIGLTKNEYLDTKRLIERSGSPELKAAAENAFKRLRNSTVNYYEAIRLRDDGACPFWGEDKLCMLQKELGENILSGTCRCYPRRSFVYMDYVEEYLCTSCEAAVKLLMELPEGIEFTEGGEISAEDIPARSVTITKDGASQRPYKFYWDIKTLVMGIMKNRRYPVEDRLILLGVAFRKIDGFIEAGEDDKVASYIRSFVDIANERTDLIASAAKIPPDRERNITLAARNLMIHAAKNLISRDFYVKISGNYGIKYNTDTKTDDNGNITKNVRIDTADIRFAERRSILCEFFSKDREYILENVMLNTILYLNLPFRNPKLSFSENHFYICLIYNTLMFALAGYINDPDDSASVAEGIGLFSRGFLHIADETSVIEKAFSDYRFNSLKDMIAMIKF